jgi:uracil phosphoribosyltransferase
VSLGSSAVEEILVADHGPTFRDWGIEKVTFICALASQAGLERAESVWPEGVRFVVGAVDPELDGHGYVKPGFGDIGDRLFGTSDE